VIDRRVLLLRLVLFLGVFALGFLLERLVPARPNRRRTSAANVALAVLATVTTRLLVPLSLVFWAAGWHGGLFPLLGLGVPWAVALGVAGLDLAIYGQHRLFHRWGWLWRFHRVHHADPELDVSSGIRFHPGEFVLSTLVKLAAITLLGVPALGVLVFEILLNTSSLLTHANLRLPSGADRVLRRLFVTPPMHLVHHSVHEDDLDHNFGFCLSLWDRLFGTYRERASGEDPTHPRLGLPGQTDDPPLLGLLLMPFRPGPPPLLREERRA
jgi:sterol desaturase/sphingolipid hydroxylase (fatty acid hydroxylase superfamily)